MTRNAVKGCVAGLILGLVFVAPSPHVAQAIPTLQMYIEGSTYDTATETWVFTGDDFRLWVLGDVGTFGTIHGVKLTAAFPTGLTGTITLTGATATFGLLPSPGDPSVSPASSPMTNPSSATNPSGSCGSNGTIGTIPCMGNGRVLPSHDEYGAGVQWIEFLLGDFTEPYSPYSPYSPIGDYQLSLPTSFPSVGQINAYDVNVAGFPASTEIHFDAFDHIVQRRGRLKYVFAPFSHDVLDSPAVPEPSTLLLLGSGLAGVGLWRRKLAARSQKAGDRERRGES